MAQRLRRPSRRIRYDERTSGARYRVHVPGVPSFAGRKRAPSTNVKLTVLMNCGPWLSVPPPGYGGIENVIAALVPELRTPRRPGRAGHRRRRAPCRPTSRSRCSPTGQFAHLQRPYNQVCGIAAAHLHRVVRELRGRDDVVLVHDHQEAFGLTVLGALGPDMPPVLHTLHWDLRKHPELYGNVAAAAGSGSTASRSRSWPPPRRPAGDQRRARAPGHPAGRQRRPPAGRPEGRAPGGAGPDHPVKGQDVAARLAHRPGSPLVLAGPVGPLPHAGRPGRDRRRRPTPTSGTGGESVEPLVDGAGALGRHRARRASATTLVATARRRAVPDRLGGARRHRRRRVARPRHAGRRVQPGLPARAHRVRPHRAAGRPR